MLKFHREAKGRSCTILMSKIKRQVVVLVGLSARQGRLGQIRKGRLEAAAQRWPISSSATHLSSQAVKLHHQQVLTTINQLSQSRPRRPEKRPLKALSCDYSTLMHTSRLTRDPRCCFGLRSLYAR